MALRQAQRKRDPHKLANGVPEEPSRQMVGITRIGGRKALTPS